MAEIRCPKCGKMIACVTDGQATIEFKCPRCKEVTSQVVWQRRSDSVSGNVSHGSSDVWDVALFETLTQTHEELSAARSLQELVAQKLGLSGARGEHSEPQGGSASAPVAKTIARLALDNLHAAVNIKAWAASLDRAMGGVPVTEDVTRS